MPPFDGLVASANKPRAQEYGAKAGWTDRSMQVCEKTVWLALLLSLAASIAVINGSALASSNAIMPQRHAPTVATCPNSHLANLILPKIAGLPPDGLPYDRLTPYNTRLDLGLGHLRPEDRVHTWGWFNRVRLPLFHTPNGTLLAWIFDGWFLPQGSGERRYLGTGGMVETDYESPSFIVYENRSDGWFRLRYTGHDGIKGTAWSHRCLFPLSPLPLEIERWETRFFSQAISPLFFRTQVPHALREAPSTAARRLRWIPSRPGQYHLKPLEIRADWMRVLVTIPSDYCAGPNDLNTTHYDGWVKWRDVEMGPWLWYHTRGC